jgi:hypothetical protein
LAKDRRADQSTQVNHLDIPRIRQPEHFAVEVCRDQIAAKGLG